MILFNRSNTGTIPYDYDGNSTSGTVTIYYTCTASDSNSDEPEISEDDYWERHNQYQYWLGKLGAFIGYCRLPIIIETYILGVKYWTINKYHQVLKINLQRKPIKIMSGFVDYRRGRHWDRKRKF